MIIIHLVAITVIAQEQVRVDVHHVIMEIIVKMKTKTIVHYAVIQIIADKTEAETIVIVGVAL